MSRSAVARLSAAVDFEPPPFVERLPGIRARLAALRALQDPAHDGGLDSVRSVLVLASSSRGGSSMFLELLRQCDGLLHPNGEINPFLALAGLGWPDSGSGSDALSAGHAALSGSARVQLGRDLIGDASRAGPLVLDEAARRRFALDLCWRLTAQWTQLQFDPDEVTRQMNAAFAHLVCEQHWRRDEFRDSRSFYLQFLREVRRTHPEVNPWYYDLPAQQVRTYFPDVQPPSGPPQRYLLEEPPFVLARPRRPLTMADLQQRSLLVKAPANVYRLAFLRALFPHAQMRILHLTRNPASAINGLVDGWRFRGFHAHRVAQPLRIRGYSELSPEDSAYWKFDMPPDWQAYTDKSLLEVCAHQWVAAHSAVLDWLARSKVDSQRVRFEDTVGPLERRAELAARLSSWLGMRDPRPLTAALQCGLDPVMATVPPRRRRWLARLLELEGVLESRPVLDLTERLGEGDRDGWI